MKKSLLLLAGLFGFISVNAQEVEQYSKFSDHWSVGVNVGGITPMTNSDFIKDMRLNVGVDVNKQFSPIYGLTLENMWSVNTFESTAAFDASNLALLHRVNLNNIFKKYDGTPSLFELEAVAGCGWLHVNDAYNGEIDGNWITTKAGLNFNFNVGEKKAWVIAFKPSVNWIATEMGQDHLTLNANRACYEFAVGVTYRFNNSHGNHYFSNGCSHAAEIAALTATVAALEGENASKDRALNNAQNSIKGLQTQLRDCQNKKPQVITKKVGSNEYFVVFRQSSSKVDATQMPNVDRLASFLKNNSDAKVVISGYASPEGDAKFNERLAVKRAEAVKKVLVKTYGISEDRIEAEGKGIGTIFDTPKYNRVGICVVK